TVAPAKAGAQLPKVLRYAFDDAETTADPQKVSDIYSIFVISAIFDSPLDYDYLARPLKLKPVTVEALPVVTDGGRTFTLKVKPGIYFDDDPAFKGQKRELTAADYVYSMKRAMDPRLSSPLLGEIEGKILGSEAMLATARKAGRLDYDAPFEGIKALDRYTWQVKLSEPSYIFTFNFADCRLTCAVAREVVEMYGDDVGAHPIGTGPYRMAFWKRSSKMVFERNPNFREEYFDGEPAPGDERAAEILRQQKGKRLPMIDRVEAYVVEETQPRWLAFLNGDFDLMFKVPEEFAYQAMPNNKLAPGLARKGIAMEQVPALDLTFNYFNMDDPVVGGYTPEKVALRRAIVLAYKTQDEIAIIRKGQAIQATTPYSPGVAGYDPNFRTTAGEYDVAKAKALLDMFGYVDRDGDGYREMPDGSRFEIKSNSTPTHRDQQLDELWKRSMDDIGVRISFRKAKWPDLLKESDAGKLMFWQLGGNASAPDADTWLQTLYSPNAGFKGNRSRFRHPEYDRLYEQARVMPDSPERTRLYQQMAKIVVAYAPLKLNTHRILTDMWYPWVIGFRRPLSLGNHFWKYMDIDLGRMPAR
ncbi:MAG: ABC transporter substrate-binding protein, partial [Usitatibacter sp.]